MAHQWYVVHTYSGFENRVKQVLEEKVKSLGKENLISEIIVPTEKVVELVKGERKTATRKFFPGYILVKMEINEESWHLVKSTPKVTGFVGGLTQPAPVSEEEVARITHQMAEGRAKPKPKVMFEVGELVRVIDGPFTNFSGVVEDVRPDKGKLRVMVSIFGRSTPVELEFIQVEKG